MRNQPIARFGAAVFALGLSACAGNQGSSALPVSNNPSAAMLPSAAEPAAGRLPHGATSLAITLPPIQPKGTAIDWAALPNSLSSGTELVAGTIGKKPFGPIALSSSQSNCQTSSAGLVCTVTVDASPGTNVPVELATYAKKTGVNDELATGAVTLSIFKGSNVTKPAMTGIARSFGVKAQRTTLPQGFVNHDRLAIYGVDASKSAIPSNAIVSADGAVQKNFEIAFSGPVDKAKSAHDCTRTATTCWGEVTPFLYDGLKSGTETITVSVKGFPDATEGVKVLPGTATAATLLTQGTFTVAPLEPNGKPQVISFISEFPLDASGNVAPARTFMPGYAPSYGEDASGNFWVGATHLSNRGAVLGTVALPAGFKAVHVDGKGRLYAFSTSGQQCILSEYPAGKYGSPKPLRQIHLGSCQAGNPTFAVDDAGNVFVAGVTASQTVNEYAATGSGALTPTRTIPVASIAYTTIPLDTDHAGNLYVLSSGDSGYQLQRFVPGSTTGTQLLSGVRFQNFAVDDAGDIYTCAATNGPVFSLEYFTAGSSAPSRTINGSKSMLSCDPIVVPRS